MQKQRAKRGRVRVRFELPADVQAASADLLGDFNDWSPGATPMKRRKDGSFVAKLRLEPGRYRFRYLLDGERWMNDPDADASEPNPYGSDDSIVEV